MAALRDQAYAGNLGRLDPGVADPELLRVFVASTPPLPGSGWSGTAPDVAGLRGGCCRSTRGTHDRPSACRASVSQVVCTALNRGEFGSIQGGSSVPEPWLEAVGSG